MRAIIVSRFPIYREALARLMDATFGHDTADGAATLQEAVDAAAAQAIDLMVVEADSANPDMDAVAKAASAIRPAPLLLFATLSPLEVQLAYEAGVKGCVPKTAPADLLAAALRLILAGGLYFSDFSNLSGPHRADAPLRSRLSSRQLEVLRFIEMGQTNKEIAKALGISVATVKLHVQAILNVTGARNRTEAALRTRGQVK
jgi:DNA-binding NarL/FixJ family response regulator